MTIRNERNKIDFIFEDGVVVLCWLFDWRCVSILRALKSVLLPKGSLIYQKVYAGLFNGNA